jgi:NAD(P)-dependent dehydrogenase (short-subunit alcohol dehydrogenase family)
MDLGIKGRRAIVTGGSSGIGFETARLFLDEGVRVLITGREMAKVNQARDALAKKSGGEVHAVVADMTKQADITRMVEFAKEKFGGVDRQIGGRSTAPGAARKNSLNRFGKPEELANATVFLCSERASYITGVSLNLDGGRLKGLW